MLAAAEPGVLARYIANGQIFIRDYIRGAAVHRQHNKCVTLDIVLTGVLAAYSLSENGSVATLFEFKENGIIGANLLFGDHNVYPLSIYPISPCTLVHITKEAVLELLHGTDFVMHYIRSLSSNSQSMNRKITMLTQKTLQENLLDYLRQQAILQNSHDVYLPISKKELADNLGVQRPSLFREFKRLKDKGMIDVANRVIKILTLM